MPTPDGYESAAWAQVQGGETTRQRIREAVQARQWPLYIHGPTGTGKSHLMALIHASVDRGAVWRRADDLLEDLSQIRRTSLDRELRNQVRGCRLLCLDDLGVRVPNEYMGSQLFDLLEARRGKPLVVTSNHPLGRMAGQATPLSELYDDRIISRLAAGTVIAMLGSDRRRGQGKGIVLGADR